MRVLIAEDDPVSRIVLKTTLQKWGYDTIVFENGRDALSVLDEEFPPEIAILDWMMPEMDGLEVCRRLRRSASQPMYIMLLTAKTQREDLVAGLGAGADDYIMKPFSHQELYARIQVGIRVTGLQRGLADRVRDLEVAMTRLRRLQQTQKLEALGQLASGIAHEINTPAQFISANLRFLQQTWIELQPVLERAAKDPETDYGIRETPKAIEESLLGVDKISKIVQAMRDFCQARDGIKTPVDINQAIRTTITVATNKWSPVANLTTALDPALPQVLCVPGEIHDVLLHLIVNAADAIAEARQMSHPKGAIHISTSAVADSIEIRVRDTGTGIRDEHREKIFEPFFTTKDVGKGAGQGLATAYSTIVHQHNGRIWFETGVTKGTTFFIRLPRIGEDDREHDERKVEQNPYCR